MRFGVNAICCSQLPSLFSNPEKGFCRKWGIFPGSSRSHGKKLQMETSTHQLRCRECGKTWGNQPRGYCEDCFSPLEITYDYDSLRSRLSRELFASRAPNMWRYRELLPLPAAFQPSLPVGYTPLVSAPRLGEEIGSRQLFVKNDAVCLPTLSFKDRVVAVALANARSFGFATVACSSTGNLANAVAAQAAREGLKAWIFIPSDLESAKILGT